MNSNTDKGKSNTEGKKLSRRQQKKRHRLFWKIIHQKKRPPLPLYFLEVIFGVVVETLRTMLLTVRTIIVSLIVVGIVLGGIGIYKGYPIYEKYTAKAEEIVRGINKEDFAINESSTIYDSKGKVIAVIKDGADLAYIPYKDIPKDAVNAFVAVEDRTFWTNKGVDLKGIARVIFNFCHSSSSEAHGASTITQQLVRNIYLEDELSQEAGNKSEALMKVLKGNTSEKVMIQSGLDRKFKEILVSMAMNRQFTKRDIMEFYINNICFSNGIYGLGGASKAYFDKEPKDLSLSQIAYLCAIPNRPSYYDPYKNPKNALKRRNKILDDMEECGYISQTDCLRAKAETIVIKKPSKVFNNYETTYAVDCAVRYLMKLDNFTFKYSFADNKSYKKYHKRYSKEYNKMYHKLNTGGYKIYTSLNSRVYKKLQKILDKNLKFSTEKDANGTYSFQGALTCIDNKTGKVIAVVGGRSQKRKTNTYSFNRAYQGYRQPGSTFKPIAVYTPALESKYHYKDTTIVHNIDVDRAKQPGVSAQMLSGEAMSLRSAVEQSKNGVAWQVFDRISPKVGMKYVTNMKFANISPEDYYDSSALGGLTYGATTVEMASAYSTLANHGTFKEPTCIVSMVDSKGNEIYRKAPKKEIYTDKAADDMVDILKGVLIRGTGSGLGWSKASKIEAFAKTGTTNESKDGWLCGATPYYSIAVWVGYDIPKPLSNLYGATYPGQIWKECMLSVTKGKKAKKFTRNKDDESYTLSNSLAEEHSGGYYSYLEGRRDSEVLSSGYTVADYRKDRVIGESIYEVIDEIKDLNMSLSGSSEKLRELYNKGLSLVDTIYSRKYTSEMRGYLDSAYNSKR